MGKVKRTNQIYQIWSRNLFNDNFNDVDDDDDDDDDSEREYFEEMNAILIVLCKQFHFLNAPVYHEIKHKRYVARLHVSFFTAPF